MRPQVGKQKVYENAIKIVHHFVRVCEKHGKVYENAIKIVHHFVRVYEKHGKVKATEKYVKTLN